MVHVSLSEHFTYPKIFRIVIAPVLMMIFSSFYSVIDGIFLSNYAGEGAFSGVNLVFPYIMILAGVGMMFGSGGVALVTKTLGEKDQKKANNYFSMIIYSVIVVGVIFTIIGYFTVEPYARAMASLTDSSDSEAMLDAAIRYGKTMMLGIGLFMLQNAFQTFFSGAEKPFTGFLFVGLAGVTNIILDWLLIGVANMSVEGAAIASISGVVVGGVLPIFYFIFKKDIPFNLGKCTFDFKALLKVMGNGSSEFVSNIAGSIVSMCYNVQLLRYVGPSGVSAYGICMYISYAFMAAFMGYSVGISPVVGYNFGAQNHEELHNVFKKSIIIIWVTGIVMFGLAELAGPSFARIFSNGDEALQTLSSRALFIYSFIYLTCGLSIFGSGFFTGLNNGAISAIISIVRSLVFELAAIWILPLMLQSDGVWSAAPFAEIGSTAMSVFFFVFEKKKYHY